MHSAVRFIVVSRNHKRRRTYFVVDTSCDRCLGPYIDQAAASADAKNRNAPPAPNVITADVVDQARRTKTGRTPIRHARIDNALDALQSAILDLNVSRVPTPAQSMAVGRARREVWAAINANDRAERLEA